MIRYSVGTARQNFRVFIYPVGIFEGSEHEAELRFPQFNSRGAPEIVHFLFFYPQGDEFTSESISESKNAIKWEISCRREMRRGCFRL